MIAILTFAVSCDHTECTIDKYSSLSQEDKDICIIKIRKEFCNTLPDPEVSISKKVKDSLWSPNNRLEKRIRRKKANADYVRSTCEGQFTTYISNETCKPYVATACKNDDKSLQKTCLDICGPGVQKKCGEKLFPSFKENMPACKDTEFKDGQVIMVKP